jgi:uncharacterized protein (DUF1697 family)
MMQAMSNTLSTQYVAFLRGVNVGSHVVNSETLVQVFTQLGFTNIHVVLSTGNVVFHATEKDLDTLTTKIETKLEEVCGFAVPTFLRTMEQVRAIAQMKPFKDVEISVGTRLMITFLGRGVGKSVKTKLTLPNNDFYIIKTTDSEVLSVLSLQHTFRSGDAMRILSDIYGKSITTRSWNTIYRILKFED